MAESSPEQSQPRWKTTRPPHVEQSPRGAGTKVARSPSSTACWSSCWSPLPPWVPTSGMPSPGRSVTQNQADFAALDAGQQITDNFTAGTTPSTAVVNAVVTSLNGNQPQDDAQQVCAKAKTCVSAGQLTDSNLNNGEVRYTSEGLQVRRLSTTSTTASPVSSASRVRTSGLRPPCTPTHQGCASCRCSRCRGVTTGCRPWRTRRAAERRPSCRRWRSPPRPTTPSCSRRW